MTEERTYPVIKDGIQCIKVVLVRVQPSVDVLTPNRDWFGGVDEAGIDRIIDAHLLSGEIAREIAYEALPAKQALRRPE